VAQWRRGPTQENERESEKGPTVKLNEKLISAQFQSPKFN
jgi:hypothetical protein